LVKFALKRSGRDADTDIVAFKAVIDGILDKSYDGSAALWKNQAREEVMLFSVPYMYNQIILVGRKGADVSADDITDLNGKKVGVVADYAYGDLMSRTVAGQEEERNGATFIAGSSDQENLNKLLAGDLDYILVDALLVEYAKKHQPKEVNALLDFGHHILFKRSLHFAIRKDVPKAQEIIDGFNREIKAMASDGSYSRILELTWVRADMDGDGVEEYVLNGDRAGQLAPSRAYSIISTTQPEMTADNYYIDGKVYKGWDSVPDRYKQPRVTEQQLQTFNFFSLPIGQKYDGN
jgi:ABC-type amino acid transport substrate-binding protein